MRIRSFLPLLLLLVATVAEAQFRTPTPTPQACTVDCPPGPPGRDGIDGKDGRDGKPGKDGRDGVDAAQCPARSWREFDLGNHALPFPVFTVITDRFCQKRLIAYNPTHRIAVRVNPDTGIGEVAFDYTAELPPDERGPITFNAVVPLDGWAWLVWRHQGGWWLDAWPQGLREYNLASYVLPNPRTGVLEPIFRWR